MLEKVAFYANKTNISALFDSRVLNADTFEGLSSVLYLSLADNNLEEVPEHLWPKVPNVKTLDLGRTKIKHISESSFKVRR